MFFPEMSKYIFRLYIWLLLGRLYCSIVPSSEMEQFCLICMVSNMIYARRPDHGQELRSETFIT